MALATQAAHRIVMWPRYDSPADLQALATELAPALVARGHADVCLCLRHDQGLDIPLDQAVRALEGAFARTPGADAIEVLIVDDPLDREGWEALGRAATAALALPSTASDPARQMRLASLNRPILRSVDDLRRQLGGGTTAAPAPAGRPSPAPAASPKVTAIVSTYKSAAFLRGCLEDLTGQTLYARGEVEIIVIDSGSPDNEGDIVRDMQRAHPGIRYLRTERETLYAAWNRAIGMARGRYLTNANTDDRHRADALEVMAARLDGDPGLAVVYGDCLITERPNESYARNSARRRHSWPDFSYAELQRRCIVGPQPMWRKSLHERWGLFDERYTVAGDMEFWLRIGRDERFEHLPEALGLYYENPTGLEWGSGRTHAETLEIQARYSTTPAATPATAPASPGPAPAAAAAAAPGEPVVSVILPTYNRPEFLVRALMSLVDQSFRNFEVVMVNDAGQALEPVLAQFAGRLNITYVRHATNRGLPAARNTGLGVARGRYIAYLDDDDWYRSDHIESLVEPLRTGVYKVACSDSLLILEAKTAAGYQPVRQLLHRSTPFDRDRLLIANYIPVLSVMHERTCVDEVGRFDEQLRTQEDWDFFIRLSQRYEFFHLPKVTADVSYREDGSSMTSARTADFARSMTVIHERYRGLIKHRPEMLARQAEALAQVRGQTAAAPPAREPAPAPYATAAPSPGDHAQSRWGFANGLGGR
jgi:glycosyltransferase involved in cell wall biosynthesis